MAKLWFGGMVLQVVVNVEPGAETRHGCAIRSSSESDMDVLAKKAYSHVSSGFPD